VTKIFGYDYEIIYKKGKENVVANSFSRKYEEDGSLFSLSFIVPDWLQVVHQEWLQDPKISSMIHQLQHNSSVSPGYSWHNEELRYKGCLYLCKKSQLKSTVISELHASPTVGHSGFTKTYEWVKRSFFWDGMKQDVHTFVVECEVCQCNKGETFKALGTLQPLLIPPTIWRDISMDFIVGLPKSGNKSVIMVVVDHLSKYAHFCSLQHPFTHPKWLKYSWIISSSFMACLILLSLTEIPLSPTIFGKNFQATGHPIASQHYLSPQMDGQTEVVNKCLETYLRCFSSERKNQWAQWLPLSEWWYNTSYHTTTHMTPFEAVYGQNPPSFSHICQGFRRFRRLKKYYSPRGYSSCPQRQFGHGSESHEATSRSRSFE
jgi:hypothetical protein